MSKRVMIGMSGGVDSSVAAYLLKKQGYEVIGVTMKLWQDDEEYDLIENDGGCCSLEAVEDARAVADKLGIPFYVLNFKEVFKEKVIDYFIDEYLQGRTPNPCIACNKHIKFEHTLLPIGGYEKERVREIAKEMGMDVHNKPDSQEICFVKDNDYANYVKRHSNKRIKEGNFVDTKGNVLGKHKGIIYYTIGQRKGLGIAFGKPMFVLDINPKTNEVILGSNDDLFNRELIAKDVNLITIDKIREPIRVEAKIRYSAKPSPATVYNNGDDSIKIVFDEPLRAITKGQSVVMYQGDKVVGGGIIDKSL